MGFLDNIENDLKALESVEERDPAHLKRERERQEKERAAAAGAAVYADGLKTSKFTTELLDHAVRIGHALRTKVYMTWIDTTLRLQARDRRLELQPTPAGIVAKFFEGSVQTNQEPIDLNSGNAREMAERWLHGLGQRPAE